MTRGSIREYTEAVRGSYLRGSKKEKGKILATDLGWSRCCGSNSFVLLHNWRPILAGQALTKSHFVHSLGQTSSEKGVLYGSVLPVSDQKLKSVTCSLAAPIFELLYNALFSTFQKVGSVLG